MAEDPTGRSVRNLIRLRRLGNGLARDLRAMVGEFFDEVVAHVAKIDPTGVQLRYRRARLEKLLREIEKAAGVHYPALEKRLRQALAEIGAEQAAWAVGGLKAATDAPVAGVVIDWSTRGVGVNRMKAILDAEPFDGDTLARWVARSSAASVTRARRQVQLGMVQNETMQQIIGRIRRNAQTASRREAEAVGRTAVTFIANRAHLEVYEQNADVVGGVEFTATLDSRTTPICARWDGTVWDVDDPAKQVPPLHFNCRSVLTPVVDWEGLGLPAPPEGTRASRDGQVKASTTYEQWFSRLDEGEQDDIIGPTRARLFRAGKLTFRDMIGRDNRILPVSELGA